MSFYEFKKKKEITYYGERERERERERETAGNRGRT
jgi:hypothetical protein